MINFGNCELLSYDHQSNYFGEIFHYRNIKNLTIQGYVLDLQNTFNTVSGVFSGVDQLINSSQDFQPIILGGRNFGNGKINSWSFDQGTWTRSTKYTCSVEIFQEGNLSNMSGAYYGDLSGILNESIVNIKFLDQLSENFSFNQSKNGLIEANHNLNIRFISGDDGINPIIRSKYLASKLLQGGTLEYSPSGGLLATGLLYNLYFPTGLIPTGLIIPNKRYVTESYNSIN